MFQPSEIIRLVFENDEKLLAAFLNEFTFVNSHDTLYELKGIGDPVVRVMRLTRGIQDITMGADPLNGTKICAELLQLTRNNELASRFEKQEYWNAVVTNWQGTYAYGLYRLGLLHEAISFVGTLHTQAGPRYDNPLAWMANICLVRAYYAVGNYEQALQQFEHIEPFGGPEAFNFEATKAMVDELRYPFNLLPDTRDKETRSSEKWAATIPQLKAQLKIFAGASQVVTPMDQHADAFAPRIQQAANALAAMEAVLKDSGNYDVAEPTLHSLNLEFLSAMSVLMQRHEPIANTMDEVDAVNRHVQLLFAQNAADQATEKAVANAIQKIEHSIALCQRFGNRRSLYNLLWLRALVHNEFGYPQAYAADLIKLFSLIQEDAQRQTSFNIRSALSVMIPGLIPRLLQVAVELDDHELFSRASEFRRTLMVNDPTTRQTSLVQTTHYFSLTAPFYGDQIFAQLRTKCGEVRSAVCQFTLSEARRLTPYADPQSWQRLRMYSQNTLTPDQALAPLIALIDEAITARRIEHGDHIAVAVDYPLSLFPLSYIRLSQQECALAEITTLSRVPSYAAVAAAPRAVLQPVKAAGIFCQASGELGRDEKWAAFCDATSSLQRELDYQELLDKAVSHEAVLKLLKPNSVIHLHTHGYFSTDPLSNPLDHSGLLLAHRGKLATRGYEQPEHLLTPRALINSGVDLTGSHITLCACVSGLSREAQSGNFLGLEYAFRELGAASILASYWHVDFAQASKLIAGFYSSWLEKQAPVPLALQQAVHKYRNTEAPQSQQADWFAFEVFETQVRSDEPRQRPH